MVGAILLFTVDYSEITECLLTSFLICIISGMTCHMKPTERPSHVDFIHSRLK